jgi:HSP20 family molecular chaperone IbpA
MNATAQQLQTDTAARAPERAEQQTRSRPLATPRVDVHETSDAYVVTADLPGVSESALDVTLEKDQLTIEGRVEPVRRESHRLRLAESAGGGFVRSFALPDGIDRERIAATVKNGVLRLTLPKSAAVRPRKIVIHPSA